MVYVNNIYTGLPVFPFIAALFTLPYAVYQYNKHGSISKYRTLTIYSFILYMLIAFFMVNIWLLTELPLIIAGWLMNGRVAFIVDVMILLLVFISRIYFIIYFINVVLRKGKLMPHDKLSGTLYMATDIPKR